MREGSCDVIKFLRARGGDAVAAAKILRESLRPFQAGAGAPRTEDAEARGLEGVGHARGEGIIRSDYGEVGAVKFRRGDESRQVRDADGKVLPEGERAGIARGADDFSHARGPRELPGQRMLAAAGANEEDGHD